jgi:copper chaperone NosL
MGIRHGDWFISTGMHRSVPSLPGRWLETCSAFNVPWHRIFVYCVPIVCFFLLWIGCGSLELRPIEILSEDMCAFCRMAISEKRFASELITQDGEVFKFDDIGCMLRFRKNRGHPVATTFVVDFDTREWLKSEEAYFVKSKEFKTPMGGNVVAFKTGAGAAAAVDRSRGVSVRYAALLENWGGFGATP